VGVTYSQGFRSINTWGRAPRQGSASPQGQRCPLRAALPSGVTPGENKTGALHSLCWCSDLVVCGTV
jgi:hypothetical protein